MQGACSNSIDMFIALVFLGLILSELFRHFLNIVGYKSKIKAKEKQGEISWASVAVLIFLLGLIFFIYRDAFVLAFGIPPLNILIGIIAIFIVSIYIFYAKVLTKG